MRLSFDHGTILITAAGAATHILQQAGALYDHRVDCLRAPAYRYCEIRARLAECCAVDQDAVLANLPGVFRAPGYQPLRPYQQDALICWSAARRRGIVVLPTGSGKTHVALAAMRACGVSCLCVVPTRALLHQWIRALWSAGAAQVGQLGDGQRALRPITVATTDSARIHMARIGNRFRLLIVDEVHHFGNRLKDEALELSTAEYRLGLTATPPDDLQRMSRLAELVGPVVFRQEISDLAGKWLAQLDLVVLRLALTPEEHRTWELERRIFSAVWRDFRTLSPGANWTDFVRAAHRTESGREALEAWRRARNLLTLTREKVRAVGRLLERHRSSRTLVFTADNRAAYQLSKQFLIMPITCHIRRQEREAALDDFRLGRLSTLVSSRVLNEGLDVPQADLGIVVSGAHGEREHIQRIGRLLRPAPGKRATLYELVTRMTPEVGQSKRRNKRFENPLQSDR